jgi:hypothetical protein
MKMNKEFYIETLEMLVADYLDEHPGSDWDEAYALLSDKAYDVALDRYADMVDYHSSVQRGY